MRKPCIDNDQMPAMTVILQIGTAAIPGRGAIHAPVLEPMATRICHWLN